MPRTDPLDPPATNAAAAAAAVALDREVADATRIEEGLNAIYRIDLAGGDRAVLKAATFATDAEFLPEPRLLARIGRETAVPVPDVLATIGPDEGPLGVAYFVATYCAGRAVTDVLALSPSVHERLLAETGGHLAALHDLRVADGFGNLRVGDDEFALVPRYESWGAWFAELANEATDGLLGAGYVNDDEGWFVDLEPAIRAALTGFRTIADGRTFTPSIINSDHRPANLVLAPEGVTAAGTADEDATAAGDVDDEGGRTIRAVLDFGGYATGDALLDLALAEDALIDVPLGGTDRADRLRATLRTAYLDGRDADRDGEDGNRDDPFDDRYPYYRLYARTRRLGSFGYMAQFAREDDRDEVARRWRSFVRRRLAEIE